MTDAKAPGLPNAAIDFNKLHDNAVAGKTGEAMLDGTVLAKGETKAEPSAPKPAPKAAAKPAA